MSNLPAGVRRVYNYFYKRRATGDNFYTPTPTQIKEYFDSQGFDIDSITDEQFNRKNSERSLLLSSNPTVEKISQTN